MEGLAELFSLAGGAFTVMQLIVFVA